MSGMCRIQPHMDHGISVREAAVGPPRKHLWGETPRSVKLRTVGVRRILGMQVPQGFDRSREAGFGARSAGRTASWAPALTSVRMYSAMATSWAWSSVPL